MVQPMMLLCWLNRIHMDIFLDFVGAFNLSDRQVCQQSFVSVRRVLYSHTIVRVKVYNELLNGITTASGVHKVVLFLLTPLNL